jgi:hypothetical protein
MTSSASTLVDIVRQRRLDAELAALLWFLAEDRVPIHIVAPSEDGLAAVLRELAADPASVTDGPGASIDEVLRQPVPLRPATGAIVMLDSEGRVTSAHLLRPPLRDGAGHVRPQGPAVLAARVVAEDRLEHFAWGVLPELAAGSRRKAGEIEVELDERTTLLAGVAASTGDADAVRGAMRQWSSRRGGRLD